MSAPRLTLGAWTALAWAGVLGTLLLLLAGCSAPDAPRAGGSSTTGSRP